jgi:hypothetical protein
VIARHKFHVGDRVRMTPECAAAMNGKTPRTGVVVGYGRRPHLVQILRDGLKTPASWDCEYWDAATEEGK